MASSAAVNLQSGVSSNGIAPSGRLESSCASRWPPGIVKHYNILNMLITSAMQAAAVHSSASKSSVDRNNVGDSSACRITCRDCQ